MGTRGETQETERESLTLPPPSNRRVPRRMTSKGEGGWALWRPQGTRRQDRRPPGRRPFREPWRSGELGRPWRIRGLRRPWRVRGLGRPWRIGELGWPWWIRELRRPWRIGELGWPWWIRELRRPWRVRGLGRPWRSREHGRPWRVVPPQNFLGEIPQQGLWRAGRDQQGLWRAGRDQQGLWRAGRDQQGLWRAGRDQQGLWRAGRDQQGLTEEGEGASRTPTQSPSQLNPPPCPAVPGVLSAPSPPWCRGRSSTPHSHRTRQAPSWWALSPALAPDLTGWAGPAATKMSWAEPVETPAGLREPRMVRGLRWPRMVADLPQTTGWTSRRRRRRFPANGEQGRAAAGGGPLPREQNQETKNFQKREENKTGWKWHRGHCIFGSSILSRMYGGARNEDTRNFVKHFIITTRRSQRSLENRYTPKWR